MPIASTVTKQTYEGNGATTLFPYPFAIFDPDDIKVYITDPEGNDTLLSAGYQVNTDTSEVEYPYPSGDPLAAGYKITLLRLLSLTQETALPNQGPYYAKTIERLADRQMAVSQQQQEQIDRTLKLAISTPDTVSRQLPAPIAKQLLRWNENGTALENTPPGEDYADQAANSATSAAESASQYPGLIVESTGYGIISGGDVTFSGMTYSVSALVAHMPSGKREPVAAVSDQPINSADATNPRIDLIYISAAGIITYLAGTPAETPTAPTLPDGAISLRQFTVAAGATSITSSTDTRTYKPRYNNLGIINAKDAGLGSTAIVDCSSAMQLLLNIGGTVILPDGTYNIASTITADNNTKIVMYPNAIIKIMENVDGIILKRNSSISGGIIVVDSSVSNYTSNALVVSSEKGEGIFGGAYPIPQINNISLVGNNSGTAWYLHATGNDNSSFIVFRRFNNITISGFPTGVSFMAGDGTAPGSGNYPYINGNTFSNITIIGATYNFMMYSNVGEVAGNQFNNIQIQGGSFTVNIFRMGNNVFGNQVHGVYAWDLGTIGSREIFKFESGSNNNYILTNGFSNQFGNSSAGIANSGTGNVVDTCYARSTPTINATTVTATTFMFPQGNFLQLNTGFTYPTVLSNGWTSALGNYLKFYVPGSNSYNQPAKLTLNDSKAALGDFTPNWTLDVPTGYVNSTSGYKTNGADYGEFFESMDGTRLAYGTTVVMENGKVRAATSTDDANQIFGAVSATCSLIGDSGFAEWPSKYLIDDYGVVQYETTTETQIVIDDKGQPVLNSDGTYKTETVSVQTPKLNPSYDQTKTYTLREDRPEWNTIGFLGKVRVTKGQPVNPNWVYMYDISTAVAMYLIK